MHVHTCMYMRARTHTHTRAQEHTYIHTMELTFATIMSEWQSISSIGEKLIQVT